MTTILIVEDDISLSEIYKIRLEAEGFRVVTAEDGEKGLAVAVREKPTLILSDIMMPRVSGFDMLDILKKTPSMQDIKVVMMTALGGDDQKERGDDLGADAYLVKSQVGIEDVVAKIKEVLAGGQAQPVAPVATDPAAPVATEPVAAPVEAAPEIAPAVVAPEPVATEPAVAPAEVVVPSEPAVAVVEPAPVVETAPVVAPTLPVPEVAMPAPEPVVEIPAPEVPAAAPEVAAVAEPTPEAVEPDVKPFPEVAASEPAQPTEPAA